MSDTLAIAAVTESFMRLLSGVNAGAPTDPVKITADPLDLARSGANASLKQLNLFLYQVTPNLGWINMDMPIRGSRGDLTRQPVLALDLHYLLTAYGRPSKEPESHQILAHAMSLVHDGGVLTRAAIRAALDAAPAPMPSAGLDDQVEMIKLAPEPLSDEELFRMWSVFGAEYRISVGYLASVVLVERPHRRRSAPPVRAAGVAVAPLRRPLLDELEPAPVTTAAPLVLAGERLGGPGVVVRLNGSVDVSPAPADVSDERISLAVPAALRAGPSTVQVLHDLPVGSPPQPRRFASSNVLAFVLAPRATAGLPATVARGATLTVTLSPPVDRRQDVVLVLDDVTIARTVTSSDPATEAQARFAIPATGVAPGQYLARVGVDGAETALEVDGTGTYSGPVVTVT
ncbi:MAG TPA: DUF4255 domain-containing protein [Solirubrobacteraceae bacterium]|nr:DUF4255 domain-containing protein [Solirubrobacteraceae bacterium]